MNWRIKLLGWRYIPLLGFANPKLVHLDDDKTIVKIKLRRRTKNHLGALAIGADTAAGIYAFALSEQMGVKIHFSFKSSRFEFLKRAESNVLFVCSEGEKIKKAMGEAKTSKERVNVLVNVEALNDAKEVVSKMEMELSLKVK